MHATSAVLLSFINVERELGGILIDAGVRRSVTSARPMALIAEGSGLISPETRQAIEGLAVLRNLAVHARADDLTASRALEYILLAEAVLYSLRSARERVVDGSLKPTPRAVQR